MDKETRNALQNATQRARALLTRDFEEQLEGTYDVLRSGAVAPDGGSHLTARERTLRPRIVASIAHKEVGGMKAQQAVQDYVRDAAFTTLNRFAALKMLEARGLVLECVSRGDQSSGFAEFTGAAPGVKSLPEGEGYRLFIECIFDELSTEVKVLFDRRDPASALWPKRSTFQALLDVFNAPELGSVWSEDETIGWIYQYFNSGDERRAMREASQAPRNGRELAVRNQFFTPAYVVRFLVDNTLGRLWYEMLKGETRITNQCQYMVRQPGESFADEDEEIPPDTLPEGMSQEELWERPIKVPHRPKKDPRGIRGIDPACGSGHFLLGLFEIFLTIYDEAWADTSSPVFADTGRTLRDEYPDKSDFQRAIPGMILHYNLHGVDIDPRCTQIAQLALWMRAQRAFQAFDIQRSERLAIRRSNVATAEPMPGEREMLADFVRGLREDRLEGLLGRALNIPAEQNIKATKAMANSLERLVVTVWDEMRLAGDMGLLLRIEEALSQAIMAGRAEWEDRLPLFRVSEYGLGGSPNESYASAVPGGHDDFWSKAEALVFQALSEYASLASGAGSARRRLFADDAARGFAVAKMATKRFDVVLMNPPFGSGSSVAKADFDAEYPKTRNDIYAAFVERGIELLQPRGRLGAITSRTGFFLSSFQPWREEVLLQKAPPVLVADLGIGVLDSALVEVAAYCLEARG